MFNKTSLKVGSNSQTVHFNTPSSGILQKSHPKSRFIRFQRNSDFEGRLFPLDQEHTPHILDDRHKERWNIKKVEVTVLQILIFGEDHYLCEIVENSFLVEEDEVE